MKRVFVSNKVSHKSRLALELKGFTVIIVLE
jgi:hypothetical protein